MTSPQPISTTQKQPLTVTLFLLLACFMGGWLIFDGLHQRLFGDYVRINGQLGPWANLVTAVGLDLRAFAWFFIVLGNTFIICGIMLTQQRRWAYQVGLIAACLSLVYLGLGTPFALAALVLLLVKPTRIYIAPA